RVDASDQFGRMTDTPAFRKIPQSPSKSSATSSMYHRGYAFFTRSAAMSNTPGRGFRISNPGLKPSTVPTTTALRGSHSLHELSFNVGVRITYSLIPKNVYRNSLPSSRKDES